MDLDLELLILCEFVICLLQVAKFIFSSGRRQDQVGDLDSVKTARKTAE